VIEADLKSEARHTLHALLMQLLRMGCQALVLLGIARLLGAHGYGTFAAVVSLASVFAPIAGLGVDFLALRMVARTHNVVRQVFNRALGVTLISSVPLIGIATFIARLLFPDSVTLTMILAVLISDVILLRINELIAKIYQGRSRIARMGSVRIMSSVCRLVALVIFWWSPMDGTPTMWSLFYLAASFSSVMLTLGWILNDFRSTITAAPAERFVLSDGIHFAGGVVSARLYTEADKTLVLALSSATGAGVYAAAYRIVEFSMIPAVALLAVVQGKQFDRAHHRGAEAVIRAALSYSGPCLLLGALIACVFWWLLVPVMVFAAGSSFAAVTEGLLPIALLPLAMSTRMIGEQTIAAVDLLKKRSFLQWSTAAVAVAANVRLIPEHGWVAAAWVCFVAETFLGLCYGYIVMHLHRNSSLAKSTAS